MKTEKKFPKSRLAGAIGLILVINTPVLAAPQGGKVKAGAATISQQKAITRIDQHSDRAVIDWRQFNIARDEQVNFIQPTNTSAILNRVTGAQQSSIQGRLNANGQVLLINPHGIIFGRDAQINVGSLIASTSNLGNEDFMAGRLEFKPFGDFDNGIENYGTITAEEGGLVAMVAPFVRNDGIINARLGKVALAAGEQFTLDLYGDDLINLAISEQDAKQLFDSNGKPVSSLVEHSGSISVEGGEAVLISAAQAKFLVDHAINVSGVIAATTVSEHKGKIVLKGPDAQVAVSGVLDVSGRDVDEQGGSIDVLGQDIRLAENAELYAQGQAGGGEIHVGGDFQGQGDRLRSQRTTIASGAYLDASAVTSGNGGKVIVWSDGDTDFAGDIYARGGQMFGDGGFVEVSGKSVLNFFGFVDAGADFGVNGQLLLDPTTVNIGQEDAALISRVLRTGTSTAVQASQDINVNAAIDGRGRYDGGGLSLTAGNNLNVNDFIITQNGAINLTATHGAIAMAAGKALFSGKAPISLTAGADLYTGALVTSGILKLVSTGGSVYLNSPIDPNIRSMYVNAANSVAINQPVVMIRNGGELEVNAANDIAVNAQIDGRGGSAGGTVSLTAGDDISLGNPIITANGKISLVADQGAILSTANAGLFAGNALIELSSFDSFSNPILSTGGPVTLRSVNGSVLLDREIDPAVAGLQVTAFEDVAINKELTTIKHGQALNINAGRDIDVNAQIDGRDGVASGGSVTLSAGNDVNIDDHITTNNGAIDITATSGTIAQAAGKQLRAGNASISVSTGGDLNSASYVTTGSLSIASTAASVNIDEPIYETVGDTDISAQSNVNINQRIVNVRSLHDLTITAGNDINVDAQIGQDREEVTPTGAITLTAGHDVIASEDVVTRDDDLTVTATTGTVVIDGPGKQFRAGSGTLSVTAGGDLHTDEYRTTGPLNITSTGGIVHMDTHLGIGSLTIPNDIASYIPIGPLTVTGVGIEVNKDIVIDNDMTFNAGELGFTNNVWIDSLFADMTITSVGNITTNGAGYSSKGGTIKMTSTAGMITEGDIVLAHLDGISPYYPSLLELNAKEGIVDFNTSHTPNVSALSSDGPISLFVASPSVLRVATFSPSEGKITLKSNLIGNDVILSSANDIETTEDLIAGDITFIARGNITMGDVPGGYHQLNSLTINPDIADSRNQYGVVSQGNVNVFGNIWINSGEFWASAGNNLTVTDSFHINGTEPLTLIAGNNLTLGTDPGVGFVAEDLNRFEVLGDVYLSALDTDSQINIYGPIGHHVNVGDFDAAHPDQPGISGQTLWNPTDLGVNSLVIYAPGNNSTVDMMGARAQGDVTITTNALSSLYDIESVSGTLLTRFPNLVAFNFVQPGQAVPQLFRLLEPEFVAPAVAAEFPPLVPAAPLIPGALPPGAPTLPEILVSSPSSVDASTSSAPGAGGGDDAGTEILAASKNAATSDVIESNSEEDEDEQQDEVASQIAEEEQLLSGPNPFFVVGDEGEEYVIFSGGRGVAQTADLGRSGSVKTEQNVFAGAADDQPEEKDAQVDSCGGGGYFGTDAFGNSRGGVCNQ